MTARWTLAGDAHGDPTLWHGPTAVARPADLRVPDGYRQPLFSLLAAALTRDDDTVERVAEALYHQRVRPTQTTTGARRRRWLELTADARDRYRAEARAALAALAGLAPESETARPGGWDS